MECSVENLQRQVRKKRRTDLREMVFLILFHKELESRRSTFSCEPKFSWQMHRMFLILLHLPFRYHFTFRFSRSIIGVDTCHCLADLYLASFNCSGFDIFM